jgi:hypothetical protein
MKKMLATIAAIAAMTAAAYAFQLSGSGVSEPAATAAEPAVADAAPAADFDTLPDRPMQAVACLAPFSGLDDCVAVDLEVIDGDGGITWKDLDFPELAGTSISVQSGILSCGRAVLIFGVDEQVMKSLPELRFDDLCVLRTI